MAQVLVLLARIIATLSNVSSILNNVLNIVGLGSTEATVQAVLNQANAIYGAVTDSSNGLAAIQGNVEALAIQLALVESTLAAQIGAPLQAGSVVTLPTTPPPAYGGGDPTDVATAVWNYFIISAGNNASDVLSNAGLVGVNLDIAAVSLPTAYDPAILVGGPWTNLTNPPPVDSLGQSVDFTTILPTDLTPADWMNRVNPTLHVWEMHNDYARFIEDTSGFYYTLNISQWEFQQLRDGIAVKLPPLAPAYPGLDKITSYGGFAITDGETFTGLCDGVQVFVTGVPAGSGRFAFGSHISYRNLGAVAFVDDNGDYELPQNLGFTHAVYMVKSMAHAAGLTFRCKSGFTGIAYPFYITP